MGAGKKDTVWVADQVVTIMRANLDAALVTVAADYSDGIGLPAIPSASMFIAEKRRLAAPPFLCIIPDRADPGLPTGEDRYDIEFHYLTAAVVDGGNIDEERLKRRCGRYLRAIQQVLQDNPTLGSTVEDAQAVPPRNYAPMMAGDSGLIQEAQVTIRVVTML